VHQLLSLIQAGGITMIPILVASVVAVALIIEAAWALGRSRKRYEHHLLNPKAPADAASRDVFSTVLAYRQSHPYATAEEVRTFAEIAFGSLERKIGWLQTLAAIAPLLGLFGTVSGMIHIFSVVSTSRPTNPLAQLAGGISEALVATGGGLLVAIVAALGYSMLINRLDAFSSTVVGYLSEQRRDQARPKHSPTIEEAKFGAQ
jgi:biopolymer transport protein ExbB